MESRDGYHKGHGIDELHDLFGDEVNVIEHGILLEQHRLRKRGRARCENNESRLVRINRRKRRQGHLRQALEIDHGSKGTDDFISRDRESTGDLFRRMVITQKGFASAIYQRTALCHLHKSGDVVNAESVIDKDRDSTDLLDPEEGSQPVSGIGPPKGNMITGPDSLFQKDAGKGVCHLDQIRIGEIIICICKNEMIRIILRKIPQYLVNASFFAHIEKSS